MSPQLASLTGDVLLILSEPKICAQETYALFIFETCKIPAHNEELKNGIRNALTLTIQKIEPYLINKY
jgi:hypothetical protein